MSHLNSIYLNVNGVHNCFKVLQQFKKEKGVISFLQEKHLTQDKHKDLPPSRTFHAMVILVVKLSSRGGKRLQRTSFFLDIGLKKQLKIASVTDIYDTEEINSIMVWDKAKAVLRGDVIASS